MPDDADIKAYREKSEAQLSAGFYTVPSILAEEAKINVFMRCRESKVQAATGQTDPVKVMHCLREWKNSGKKPAL